MTSQTETLMTPMPACVLDHLMPMHMIISPTGHIRHAGPCVGRILVNADVTGRRILELFELTRPRAIRSMQDLSAHFGKKLHLKTRDGTGTSLKGILLQLPEDNGMILNLSFGISVIDAVSKFKLTSADFAPTDLTVEMLYLVEAKSAVMEESRKLNLRLQGARVAAEEQAFTDTLTGLKNRRALDHVLERLTVNGGRFAVMQVDLDFFKTVNDQLGHAAGDHVLQVAANILLDETRPEDLVARAGGDEFVLIFDKLTDGAKLLDIAHRIIARLEMPIQFEGKTCQISGSIGISTSDQHRTADPSVILSAADVALYQSKRDGRASATLADDPTNNASAV